MTEFHELELDRTDLRLLREIVEDGRISDVALGERVHLSSTAAARRRKILEERGMVPRYAASPDLVRLGFGIVVHVSIELVSQTEQVLTEFEEAVVKCPSMSYCSFVSGDTDFMMTVHVRSFDDYDRVYRKELSTLPHVAKIRSSFVMRPVAQRNVPPALFEGLR
ncbi:MAG TPA: Lrp/AsnC family transcriptional regulator [Sphingobium sp.]|uniref:Lrp/AsnC family transcriptional regulator n=1 Tax=unclassified Sphingobium TaxID=2611147 RepID=UPI0007F37DD7|nr:MULTISPECIES: Lrp/AsnC family transcriptional regulator [unclassified Sphingobium]OAN56664.1 AsnC family transcriptional regulator [Sphingobium sp. TCM1]HAF43258.1 Lrp/AsnC family transcriptional regulator [Sphingobium sp.]